VLPEASPIGTIGVSRTGLLPNGQTPEKVGAKALKVNRN
jgi:hypothetical protein